MPGVCSKSQACLVEIKKWRKADPKGEAKTNSGFGWHSKTDMDKRKEYKPLIDELFKMAYECNKDFGIEGKLGLGNMWANVNPTYSYNKTHTHPNSMWSGVYYIKVPKNSGKLFLEDCKKLNDFLLLIIEDFSKQKIYKDILTNNKKEVRLIKYELSY